MHTRSAGSVGRLGTFTVVREPATEQPAESFMYMLRIMKAMRTLFVRESSPYCLKATTRPEDSLEAARDRPCDVRLPITCWGWGIYGPLEDQGDRWVFPKNWHVQHFLKLQHSDCLGGRETLRASGLGASNTDPRKALQYPTASAKT